MTKESSEGPPSGLSEAERGYNLRRKTYPDEIPAGKPRRSGGRFIRQECLRDIS